MCGCGTRSISLVGRIRLACTLLAVLMLAGLVTAYYFSGLQEELFLAVPKISGTTLSVQLVEEAGSRGAAITFESRRFENVTAINNSRSVVLIGTNHSFPFVMNHRLVHGRFFREYAVRYRHRVVVLNEYAAFELFGTTEATGNELIIHGSPYTVVGVIGDGDSDGLNIYVPMTLLGNTVETIATNLALSPSLTDIGILNEWQRLGVDSGRFHFVDFGVLRTVVRDKLILAFALVIMAVLLTTISKILAGIKNQISALRLLLREVYMKELLAKPPAWKLLGLGTIFFGIIGMFVVLAVDSFMRILVANDARGMLTDVQSAAFAGQIAEMARWYNLSNLFFTGFVIFGVFYQLVTVRCRLKGDSV